MQDDEVRSWGHLAGEAVAGGAEHVQTMHRGIAGRVFGLVEAFLPVAAPVRWIHDTISDGVYGTTKGIGRTTGKVAGTVGSLAADPEAEPGLSHPVAAGIQATIEGLIGDQLSDAGSRIVGPVSVKVDGRRVEVDADAVRQYWPDATGRMLVKLPGLFETEHAWRYKAAEYWPDGGTTHGERLGAAYGWTPVDITYPSGHDLSSNGAALAALLEELVQAWPTEVTEVAILGHSMGGLVALHGLHAAQEQSLDWLAHTSRVVCLGTPHGGSPVARGVAKLANALDWLPETRSIAQFLDRRSVGVRQLEEPPSVPAVPDVEVHLVAAVLPTWTDRFSREVVGDMLVGRESATGSRSDGTTVSAATVRTFPRMNHFDLLNHPAISAHLMKVLGPREADAKRPWWRSRAAMALGVAVPAVVAATQVLG